MELLERDGALATLAEARAEAARGAGRVVVVLGEPGIGKTSLVTRFVRDLEAGARVLFGTCDDLSIPRPLGPILDLVGSVSAPLEDALHGGAPPHEIQALVLAELDLPPRPTVLVVEDVHWADYATLDVITVLARRIGSLPVLLVLTCRDGEAPTGHPVRAAVSATRPHGSLFLELAPLSQRAVASLAGEDADEVYAATRGNPFYVTELLASRTAATLPASVTNAVLGRAMRLDAAARRLVELVSVVPNRVPTSVLDAVMPGWEAAAEEPERRRLLDVDPTYVRFRHELARNAIRSSLTIAARRRLHAEILGALLAASADPAEIVHHAEAAGAEDVVAEYALVAARRAAALESWTYDRALMLSLLADEAALVEALGIARGLGAAPLTRRLAGRLRELGIRVPAGRREATRANPAGLTARQLEVLALLTEGLTNAEIAARLVVSPRTTEHHVAAVLTKLGAATRRDAARRAAELGLGNQAYR